MKPRFEWNDEKATRNIHRHGVSFDEAASVFDDTEFITVMDEAHSDYEERYITIGLSKRGRLLLIAHTDRNEAVRIISARLATKQEEKFYANSKW